MSATTIKSIGSQLLKSLVKEKKKVIIFDCFDGELLNLFLNRLKECSVHNFVILSCSDLETPSKDSIMCISDKEMKEALNLYRLYDFSDSIMVISDSVLYGGVSNYVKNGILNKEEMVDALLCNKKLLPNLEM